MCKTAAFIKDFGLWRVRNSVVQTGPKDLECKSNEYKAHETGYMDINVLGGKMCHKTQKIDHHLKCPM